MAATTFQATVGGTAVQVSGIAALSGVTPKYGVRLSLPAANSGLVYWGTSSGVTTSTGCLIPAGGETTISVADYGALTALYLIASDAGQTVTGAAV